MLLPEMGAQVLTLKEGMNTQKGKLIPISLASQWCRQPRPVEQAVCAFLIPCRETQDVFVLQGSSVVYTIGRPSVLITEGRDLEFQKCSLVNKTDFQDRKYSLAPSVISWRFPGIRVH